MADVVVHGHPQFAHRWRIGHTEAGQSFAIREVAAEDADADAGAHGGELGEAAVGAQDRGGLREGCDAPGHFGQVHQVRFVEHQAVAGAAGLGRPSGIDLPNEAAGRVGGREFKKANWERYKDIWCARRTDPSRTPIQRAVDEDNCFGGNKFRGGDAVNLAIGQGDTVVTPLQMAVLYSAIANGGTVWQPRIAKAIISSSGEVIETTKAQVAGRLGVPPAVLAYVKKALIGVSTDGTAARDFQGFPLDQIPIASKTGSGQQVGKDPATWVASYAPANKPKYAVVMMVNQGETGSTTVGPSVRKIYEAIFGIRGGTVDPTLSVLVGGAPNSNLPKIGKDGSLTYPEKSTSS